MKKWLQKTWVRIGGLLLVGLVFGALVSEGSFLLQTEAVRRDPRRVELVIPGGTAEKIASGQPVTGILNQMTFVEGDLLVVKNQDSVSHQLGPVWVPAQASGVLQVGGSSRYSYECSFTNTKVFGLTVEPALTLWVRLQGIISVGLPTGVMLALYALAMDPKK
jgi:hypothetical protein